MNAAPAMIGLIARPYTFGQVRLSLARMRAALIDEIGAAACFELVYDVAVAIEDTKVLEQVTHQSLLTSGAPTPTNDGEAVSADLLKSYRLLLQRYELVLKAIEVVNAYIGSGETDSLPETIAELDAWYVVLFGKASLKSDGLTEVLGMTLETCRRIASRSVVPDIGVRENVPPTVWRQIVAEYGANSVLNTYSTMHICVELVYTLYSAGMESIASAG